MNLCDNKDMPLFCLLFFCCFVFVSCCCFVSVFVLLFFVFFGGGVNCKIHLRCDIGMEC